MTQEDEFLAGEADAWYRRNPSSIEEAPDTDPLLEALEKVGVPSSGSFLDIGGAAGRIAAGFLRGHPHWKATVVELSKEAIQAGSQRFPNMEFLEGSITEPLPFSNDDSNSFDIVVVSGVLCWVERSRLSRAIAFSDSNVRDGGLIVISDFDVPFCRANPYAHKDNISTYKQDYLACFLALGIYHLEYLYSYQSRSAFDLTDSYDRRWVTAVLRKDLEQRYARPIK